VLGPGVAFADAFRVAAGATLLLGSVLSAAKTVCTSMPAAQWLLVPISTRAHRARRQARSFGTALGRRDAREQVSEGPL
jgi:hypothetical protein